jgi:hypothetical protein
MPGKQPRAKTSWMRWFGEASISMALDLSFPESPLTLKAPSWFPLTATFIGFDRGSGW